MERLSKHPLLIRTMRAPEETVHPGLLSGETLGKSIVLVILAVASGIESDSKQNQDPHIKQDSVRLGIVSWLLLAISSLV